MNYYITLRLTDRCAPFKNASLNSHVPLSAAECRRLPWFSDGVDVRSHHVTGLLPKDCAEALVTAYVSDPALQRRSHARVTQTRARLPQGAAEALR